ncbi:UDP-N-acetylmuramoyl-L-alanine--D-glutamate ligase [Patescibacteria group bacterium]|nr:UDP-N-acetylmuramoyl-L-alanine--D-glutamate ligase [Patescibacteria group bacterium]
MHLSDLQNRKIAILGYGIEGRAVADFLDRRGVKYAVLDKKDGEDYLKGLSDYEIIFRSAGIRADLPEIKKAVAGGARLTSQIKFFMENCPAQIIGVTGTKGKGTTAKLIYEILKRAGKSVYLAGNIGIAAIGMLDELKADDMVVLELSSFQLQDMQTSPHIAVVLMVVPEHLDYHTDAAEYAAAKSAITKFQTSRDFAVINFDSEIAMDIGRQGSAKKLYVQTVSANGLAEASPFEAYKPDGFLKIKDGVFAEQAHGQIFTVDNGDLKFFCNVSDLPLRGFHNVQNAGAAIAVANILGINTQVILEAAREYKGLEHRLEFVCERQGVKFYNDSIGTTPESALAAMHSFSEPMIAILGGFDKKGDYEGLAREASKIKNLKAVILIGQTGPQLKKLFAASGYDGAIKEGAAGMKEIFAQIGKIAQKGDVVLLSPATSSFDMFKDYKDRGEQFKKMAMEF